MGILQPCDSVVTEALSGGVASDIWRVDANGYSVCVKRARSRLNVAAEWYAPVERNAFEARWFEVVAGIAPDAVPGLRGHDESLGLLVMEYLPPREYPVWKSQLRVGHVDRQVVEEVARRLARIHSATANDRRLEAGFATGDLFYALRVEPYLIATAERHEEFAARLKWIADDLMRRKIALVHGDISPKNILTGRRGPIFIDAECAWYGDPAFDLAFCLNHLLLKCLWNPMAVANYLSGFRIMTSTYLDLVAWEAKEDLHRRAARLLPALMLARVDGKSPVEYLRSAADRQAVRRFAQTWLGQPADSLAAIGRAWESELQRRAQQS